LIQNNVNKKHNTSGSCQRERLPVALEEGYVLVDEMSFESLIVMARDIASQLKFYGSNTAEAGTWDKLFNDNEVVIMAMISTINCEHEQHHYEQLKSKPPQALIHYILTQFTKFDLWYNKLVLNDNPEIYELKLKILSVLEKHLSNNLNILLGLIEHLNIMLPSPLKREAFGKIWQVDDASKLSLEHIHDSEDVHLVSQLELCFSAWINSVNYLKIELNNYLSNVLSTAAQDPSISMFFVFIKLFNQAQVKLNEFTKRHTDFYYRQLLQFTPLDETPDSAYLTLMLASENTSPYSLPKGKLFTCGVDNQYENIVYETLDAITVTDAKVEQVSHLYLQQDPLVSPEHEMGYVTRISSMTHHTDIVKKEASPLFGDAIINNEPSLAVAVSADILTLKEGVRKITLTLGLGERYTINGNALAMAKHTDDTPDKRQSIVTELFNQVLIQENDLLLLCQSLGGIEKVAEQVTSAQYQAFFEHCLSDLHRQVYKTFLMSLFKITQQEPVLYMLLGKIFARQILHKSSWLNKTDIGVLKDKLTSNLKNSALQRLIRLFEQNKLRTFYELYHNMFDLNVSTTEGWKTIESYVIQPLSVTSELKDDNYGLAFNIDLDPDFPEIIIPEQALYAGGKQLTTPTIMFSIKRQSTFFPYTIFRELGLKNITIDVNVKGITELLAYNQHGRLDVSKPFTPLGPQPSTHSYLVFSSDEIAHKPLSQVDINIDWAQLPQNHGGFEQYYAQYDNTYTNDSLKFDLLTIRHGQWQRVSPNKQGTNNKTDSYPMFNMLNDKLSSSNQYSMTLTHLFKPIERKNSDTIFNYDIKSRNGFFKLCLSSPDYAFGHQEYPNVLTRSLLKNAKTKKDTPLPPPPYTPLISRMTLNYQASTVIELAQLDHGLLNQSTQVLHVHPFGYEQIYPSLQVRNTALFPRYMKQGNLFIGLSASSIAGRLTLFFHLDEKAKGRFDGLSTNKQSEIQWHFLTNNCWVELQHHQVISDTTNGFLTSGIVTLDIPAAINTDNTIMPPTLFWLKASTNRDVSSYGNYFSIETHGIELIRQSKHDIKSLEHRYNNEEISDAWQPLENTASLGLIGQKTPLFGARLPQTIIDKKAISERLRHKNRAINAWDYERIILEEFPNIEYVDCLSNTRFGTSKKSPGHVLIVVRRKVNNCRHNGCDNYKVGADHIREIQQYIQSKSPSFVNVDICSPEYEQVQVRCDVILADDEHQGITLRRLNKEISEQLCPWNQQGMNKGLANKLNLKQLESFIRQLSYIKFVTNFSLLHIVPKTQPSLYHLEDTALHNMKNITPHYPWRILMPVMAHAIGVNDETIDIKPNITGVSELQINNNFVIRSTPLTSASSDKKEGQSNG